MQKLAMPALVALRRFLSLTQSTKHSTYVAPGHVVYKLEAHLVRHLEVLAAAGGHGDVVRDVTT